MSKTNTGSREGLTWAKVSRFLSLIFQPSRLTTYLSAKRFEEIPLNILLQDRMQGILIDADGTMGPHHTSEFDTSILEHVQKMLQKGKNRLKNFNNIKWKMSSAEYLPFEDEIFDYYTISFGIRNVTDINITLKESLRVLKPGGRFMCLEFSKIDNEILEIIYKQYSKAIPIIGKIIVGTEKPYKYLIDSIDNFYNQKQLSELMRINGFSNIKYRNLSNGIAAIHSGWKV